MARKRPDLLPPPEPGPIPAVISLEAVLAAQREDLAEQASRRLTYAKWRDGHADGFLRGAIWAARTLGATVVVRPPTNAPRDTLDDV